MRDQIYYSLIWSSIIYSFTKIIITIVVYILLPVKYQILHLRQPLLVIGGPDSLVFPK